MQTNHVVIIRNAAPQDFGGGERFPVFLSEALLSEGYNATILSGSKKLLNFASEQGQKTIKSWWWHKQQWSGLSNLLIPLYVAWQAILYIYYLVIFSKLKPDTVHIQSKDDFIAATHAAHSLGIKVIWTDHADLKHIWKNITVPYRNIVGKLVHHAARKVNSITVVSKSEQSLVTANLEKYDPLNKKIKVVYNGVFDSKDKYSAVEKSMNFTFLIASRLVTDKGITEGINAFKKLHEEYSNTSLVVIGDGPESDTFKQLASDTPAIQLLGHQSDPLSFMAQANAFVHPTYHEGFSVALVEAGMMSLPIIATSVGGNPEIIKDDKTGLLILPQDTDSLYLAMKRLYLDIGLQKSLSLAARAQFIEKFQFKKIVKESFIPLYKKDSF
jgi:glycosyltransferase involved in cell wall biosynthesis